MIAESNTNEKMKKLRLWLHNENSIECVYRSSQFSDSFLSFSIQMLTELPYNKNAVGFVYDDRSLILKLVFRLKYTSYPEIEKLVDVLCVSLREDNLSNRGLIIKCFSILVRKFNLEPHILKKVFTSVDLFITEIFENIEKTRHVRDHLLMLSEVFTFLIFAFKNHVEYGKPLIPKFTDFIKNYIENKEPMRLLISSEDILLEFLAVTCKLLRLLNDSAMLRQSPLIPEICVFLLNYTPNDTPELRKEIFYQIHLVALNQKDLFKPYTEVIMNTNGFFTCRPVLAQGVNLAADLSMNFWEKVSVERVYFLLESVVDVFEQEMPDMDLFAEHIDGKDVEFSCDKINSLRLTVDALEKTVECFNLKKMPFSEQCAFYRKTYPLIYGIFACSDNTFIIKKVVKIFENVTKYMASGSGNVLLSISFLCEYEINVLKKIFYLCIKNVTKMADLKDVALIFVFFDERTFKEIVTANLRNVMVADPKAIEILQFYLNFAPVSESLAKTLFDFYIDVIKETKDYVLKEVENDEAKKKNGFLKKIFYTLFKVVISLPENNINTAVVYIRKTLPVLLNISKKPQFFEILRDFFYILSSNYNKSGEIFNVIYEVFPVIFKTLNFLIDLYPMVETYVETLLSIPTSLNVLLPHIRQLVHALNIGMRGSNRLKIFSLRFIDNCLENLRSEFIDEQVHDEMYEVIDNLFYLLQFEETRLLSARVLTKLKDRHRVYLDKQNYLTENILPSSKTLLKVVLSGQDEFIPADEVLLTAIKFIRCGSLMPSFGEFKVSFVQFRNVKKIESAPGDVLYACFKIIRAFLSSIKRPSQVAYDAIVGLLELRDVDFLEENENFLFWFYENVVNKNTKDSGMANSMRTDKGIKKHKEGIMHEKRDTCGVKSTPQSGEEYGVSNPGEESSRYECSVTEMKEDVALRDFFINALVETTHMPLSIKIQKDYPFNLFLKKYMQLCYYCNEKKRKAGFVGLMHLLRHKDLNGIEKYQSKIIKALFTCVEKSKFAVKDEVQNSVLLVLRKSLQDIHRETEITLIHGLANVNGSIREISQAALEYLCELRGMTVADLLSSYKELILKNTLGLQYKANINGILENLSYVFLFRPPIIDLDENFYAFMNFVTRIMNRPEVYHSALKFLSAVCTVVNRKEHLHHIISVFINAIDQETCQKALRQLLSYMPEAEEIYDNICHHSLSELTNTIDENKIHKLRLLVETHPHYLITLLNKQGEVNQLLKLETIDSLHILSHFSLPEDVLIRLVRVLLATPPDKKILKNLLQNNPSIYHIFFTNVDIAFDHCRMLFKFPAVETLLSKSVELPHTPKSLVFMNPTKEDLIKYSLRISDLFVKNRLRKELQYVIDKNVVLRNGFDDWNEETLLEYFLRSVDEMDYNNPFEVFYYAFGGELAQSGGTDAETENGEGVQNNSGSPGRTPFKKCNVNSLILDDYLNEKKFIANYKVLESNIEIFRNSNDRFLKNQFVFHSYLAEYENKDIINYCRQNERDFASICYLSLYDSKKEYFNILSGTPTEYKRYVFKAFDSLTRKYDLKKEIYNLLSTEIFYKTHLFIIYPLVIRNEILNDEIVFELCDAVCRLFSTYVKVHQKVAIGLLLVVNNYIMMKKEKRDGRESIMRDNERVKASMGNGSEKYNNILNTEKESTYNVILDAQISTLSSLYSLYFSNCAHTTDPSFLKFQDYFVVPLRMSCLSINPETINVSNFITLLIKELKKQNLELEIKEKLLSAVNNISNLMFCDKFADELKEFIPFLDVEWLLEVLGKLIDEFANHSVIFVLLEHLLIRRSEDMDQIDDVSSAGGHQASKPAGSASDKTSLTFENFVTMAVNYCKAVCKLPNFNSLAVIKLLNSHGVLPPEIFVKNEKIGEDLDLLLLSYEKRGVIDSSIFKGFKARKELREQFFGLVLKSGVNLNLSSDAFAHLRVAMMKNNCDLLLGDKNLTGDILDLMFYDDQLLFHMRKSLLKVMDGDIEDVQMNYLQYKNYEIENECEEKENANNKSVDAGAVAASSNTEKVNVNSYEKTSTMGSGTKNSFMRFLAPTNNDSDYYYAEMRLNAKYAETEEALKLMQFDDFITAQKMLERINKELPFDEDEAQVWEREWIECAKELEQWDLVQEIGVMNNDIDLVTEALWKESNLSVEEERNALVRLVRESDKNLSLLINAFLNNDDATYSRLLDRNIHKLMIYRDRHFLNNLQVTMEIRGDGIKKDRVPMYFEGCREWSYLMTLRNHSNVLSGSLKSLHELAKNYNMMGRVCYENGHYDVAQHTITKIFSLSNIEVVDAYEKIETDLKIYKERNPQIGMEFVNIANLNYFTAAQKARLFNLKAQLISDQKEANKLYLQSVQLADLSENWYSWAVFLKETLDLTKKENVRQLFAAFLQSNSKHGIIVLLNYMRNYNFDILKQQIDNIDMREFLFYVSNLAEMLKTEDFYCAEALIERMLIVGAQTVYLELMRVNMSITGGNEKDAEGGKDSGASGGFNTAMPYNTLPANKPYASPGSGLSLREIEKIMQIAKNKHSYTVYSLEQLLSILKLALEPKKEIKFYRILNTAFNMSLNILFGCNGDVVYLKSQIRRIAIALENDEFVKDFYDRELCMKEIALLLFNWKNKSKRYYDEEKNIKIEYIYKLNNNFSQLEVLGLNDSLKDVFLDKPHIVGFEPSIKNNIIIHGDDGKNYNYIFIYNLPDVYKKEEYLLQTANILDYFMKDSIHLKRRGIKLHSRQGIALHKNTRLERVKDSYIGFDRIMKTYKDKDEVILEYLEIVGKYEKEKEGERGGANENGMCNATMRDKYENFICSGEFIESGANSANMFDLMPPYKESDQSFEMKVKETVIRAPNKVKLDAFLTMHKKMGNKILKRYLQGIFRRDREYFLFRGAFLNNFSIDSFFLYFFFVDPKQPDQCSLGLRRASLYQSNCFCKTNQEDSMLMRLTPNFQEYFNKINIEGRFLSVGHFFSKWLLESKYSDDIVVLLTDCDVKDVRERMKTVGTINRVLSDCCDPEKLCKVSPLWHPWF